MSKLVVLSSIHGDRLIAFHHSPINSEFFYSREQALGKDDSTLSANCSRQLPLTARPLTRPNAADTSITPSYGVNGIYIYFQRRSNSNLLLTRCLERLKSYFWRSSKVFFILSASAEVYFVTQVMWVPGTVSRLNLTGARRPACFASARRAGGVSSGK